MGHMTPLYAKTQKEFDIGQFLFHLLGSILSLRLFNKKQTPNELTGNIPTLREQISVKLMFHLLGLFSQTMAKLLDKTTSFARAMIWLKRVDFGEREELVQGKCPCTLPSVGLTSCTFA